MPRETVILDRIRKGLESFKGAHFLKTSGEGEPDLVGVIAGRAVAIETKQPGKKPEPLQYARLRQWAFGGAFAGWTDGEALFLIDGAGIETYVGSVKWLSSNHISGIDSYETPACRHGCAGLVDCRACRLESES